MGRVDHQHQFQAEVYESYSFAGLSMPRATAVWMFGGADGHELGTQQGFDVMAVVQHLADEVVRIRGPTVQVHVEQGSDSASRLLASIFREGPPTESVDPFAFRS
ncbi:hypothetical protein [Streptomyces plumbiresistens]|uniref:Uncharacterized protein n=1 Tax=Streptomyces plumbiresistens TaxID=511811 RepID=A0ABP7TY27_9ACTN